MAIICFSGIERDIVVDDLHSRIEKMERALGMITRTTPTSAGGGTTFSVPVGGIIMWAGAIADIPEGWALCDGTDETPDLRDRFIVGAGSSYSIDDTGGEDASDLSHTHDPGTLAVDAGGGHTHTSAGGHTHTGAGGHNHGGNTGSGSQHRHTVNASATGATAGSDVYIKASPTAYESSHTHSISWLANHTHNTTGGHTHNTISNHAHTLSGATDTAGSAAQENRPVYYALAFIMKVAD